MENKTQLYNSIYNHPVINNILDALTYNEFINSKKILLEEVNIQKDDIRKAVWFGSILANSDTEIHIKKVQELASLLFLNYGEELEIVKSAYVLMSRTGNLLATKFLDNIFTGDKNINNKKFTVDYDYILELELSTDRENSIINLDKESYLTTKFQHDLWDKLNKKENIAISAPTSSGKSFIIKKYVKSYINNNPNGKVLYIVPSRALINQVSDELRADFDKINVGIKTAFIESSTDNKYESFVYIFTPERCLKLLEYSWTKGFKLDFIFADEIQNSADESGRGTLFEYVLRELALINPKAQIISAGPNITDSSDLYYRLFGLNNIQIETSVSPVFQIRSTVRVERDDVYIDIKGHGDRTSVFKLKNSQTVVQKFKKNKSDGIPDLIKLLDGGGQNIIYSPRTDYAESWALNFVRSINEEIDVDNEVIDLIEFLKEEIHPKYYLVECLKKGVAFHHGKLPDIIRKEIEDLFLNGKIHHLFCTSTLIEGVNLPANNLFIIMPRKKDKNLTLFEFGNLIGRAGRIKNSLYGTIFSIQVHEDNWSDSYYSNLYSQSITTVSEKVLFDYENLKNKLISRIGDINEDKEQNTIIFLRHKAIKSEFEFKQYLLLKRVNEGQISAMFNILNSITKDITLSNEVLRLNPTIDPLLQENLYKEIKRTNIKDWMININSNLYERISGERRNNYEHENNSLYWQMVNIVEKLDAIFNIEYEAYFKQRISTTIPQMCLYGLTWLESRSYAFLINNDINFYKNHLNPNKRITDADDEKINSIINDIIKIHSTLVSYLLVKYFKLLNDIIFPLLTEEDKLKYKFSLALPTMLELGTKEPIVMQLISSGISRSVALKIYGVFSKINNFEDIDILDWLARQQTIGLKSIYERYLKRIHIIKGEENDSLLQEYN